MLTTASSRRNKSSSASAAKVAGKKESSTMSATDIGFAKRKHRIRGIKSMLHRRLQLISGASLVAIALIIVVVGMFKHLSLQVSSLRGGDEERNIWVSQNSQPFNQNGVAVEAKHLVMVAGHSVTVSGHLNDAGTDEKDWFLLDYQKGQGLPQAIQSHISAGINEAQKDPESLLIFSGGETRAASGPQTEAQAYYHVADAMKLWPSEKESSVRARTTTEEFATDSFENLMFSIARFREVTGYYPKKITVVSFSFKKHRFETLHVPALRWPTDRFAYVGVNPPASTGFNLKRSTEGELKNAAAPFEKDPYGCHSKVLQEKRKGRNPFRRTPPYGLSCPEMKDLLNFCGPELIPKDKVPWNDSF